MQLQQKNQNSLHKRVNDYLCGKPIMSAFEEAAVAAIFNQLHQAEEELKAAQERVDRLVWELDSEKS